MAQYPASINLSSLNGTNGFEIGGGAARDYAGVSVSSAGDVNGDGIPDLIIGAVGADPHGAASGASYVVFGKTSGWGAAFDLSTLNGANGFKLSGEAANDDAGFSVSSAGDFNGDGFDDLLVGAPYHNSHAGRSYVVFGKAGGFAANLDLSTLAGVDGFRINGSSTEDAGFSVHAAGDVNGDGYADVIVGAFGASAHGAFSGAAYVVFGHPSGFPDVDLTGLVGTNGFKISGSAAGESAGTSVSSAGDVNGDGFDDLIIGANYASPHGTYSGAAYVVFGKASGFAANIDVSSLNGANGFKLSGVAAQNKTGTSVASAGDVNGDGYEDIIVGAPYSNSNGGTAYVVFGKASGFAANLDLSTLNGTNGFAISGPSGNGHVGTSVASAGDVNGDGFDDLIIGATQVNFSTGAAYVVFGKASGFSADIELFGLDGTNGFALNGVNGGDFTGRSVSSAGDVNGDGLADLQVGAEFADPNGAYSGASFLVFGRLPDTAVTRTGTAASQHLVGGNLADVLTGGGGNDKLYGNGGNDLLTGGAGNDYFNGGLGTDTVSYQAATSGVHVSLLTTAPQNTVGAGTDTLISIEKIVGSEFADTITASATGSTLNGLNGGDDLISGPGSDILNGGGAADFADYSLAGAGVTVLLTTTGFQDTGGAGHDELISIEKVVGSNFGDIIYGDSNPNTLFGEGGDDYIDAGANDDILYGNAGADSLIGGLGQDVMTGGSGSDVFYFFDIAESTAAKPDTITDFTSGQDLIDLSDIDADTTVANDQAFHLGGGGGHAGDLIVHAFDAVHNRTQIDLYVDNNASIDAEIWLTGDHHGMTAADFVL